MTGTTLLQYLGLRRAPGTVNTTVDRMWTVVMVIAIVAAIFLTRNLGFGLQIAVLIAVAIILGVMGGAIITAVARRGRRPTDV